MVFNAHLEVYMDIEVTIKFFNSVLGYFFNAYIVKLTFIFDTLLIFLTAVIVTLISHNIIP